MVKKPVNCRPKSRGFSVTFPIDSHPTMFSYSLFWHQYFLTSVPLHVLTPPIFSTLIFLMQCLESLDDSVVDTASTKSCLHSLDLLFSHIARWDLTPFDLATSFALWLSKLSTNQHFILLVPFMNIYLYTAPHTPSLTHYLFSSTISKYVPFRGRILLPISICSICFTLL
jgi:hypothetical protein